MNKKFLAKAKHIDTGNWMYGYYVEYPDDFGGSIFSDERHVPTLSI
jgi:hypothetical protein